MLGIKCRNCADKASAQLYTTVAFPPLLSAGVKPNLVHAVQLSIFYAQRLKFSPKLNFAFNHFAVCAIGTISKKTCQGLERQLSG